MTVAELIAHLSTFPPELEVLYDRCSDHAPMYVEDVTLIKAILKPGQGYHMRVYDKHIPTMTAENRAHIKHYVHFSGN